MRYTRDELERLRESPLVVRPPNLPPAEDYMGMTAEERKTDKREKRDAAGVGEPHARRPVLEKHSRSTANPEDIILGPPRTSFASASLARNQKSFDLSDRSTPNRDADAREKYPFRKGDGENDRARDSPRHNLRSRRSDADQDSEGWSTVKPRKSFGADGAERFNGRMGGDRSRDDIPPMPRRNSKDSRDDVRERPNRGFDAFSRDREVIKESAEEADGVGRRNGFGRGRNEPSWFKDKEDPTPPPENRKSNGDRFTDRNRGWREKDRDEKTADRGNDRGPERNADRHDDRPRGRWDRDDRRQEREPEWMEESAGDQKRAHTAAEFQKWKESMNAGIMKTPAVEEPEAKVSKDTAGQNSFFGFDTPKPDTSTTSTVATPAPDKFMSLWSTTKEDDLDTQAASKKDGPAKPVATGKASRFTSFFANPQIDDLPRRMESAPPASNITLKEANPQSDKEKEDFQRLLQKLQSQSILGLKTPTPPTNQSFQPKPPFQKPTNSQLPATESFQQYRPGFQEPPRSGSRDAQSQQAALQDLLGNRSTASSQPSSRPETMVHELINQRQNTMSQGSGRPDTDVNKNAAFLMGLMQNAARPAPELLRSEQLMMRGQPQQPARQQQQQQQQQMMEREQELLMREQHERAAQRQRQEPLPAFFDDSFLGRGPMAPQDGPRGQSRHQPTHILQRPPPGLEQLPPGWTQQQQQQQQQREQPLPQHMPPRHPLQPPPGLVNGTTRGVPMPPMLPPGFPMPGYGPPPDNMLNASRNMPPPPPGFMVPPPGFMAPPPMPGFSGPEGLNFAQFDGRGPPQQGNFRR